MEWYSLAMRLSRCRVELYDELQLVERDCEEVSEEDLVVFQSLLCCICSCLASLEATKIL